MKYFFDNNFSVHLAHALHELTSHMGDNVVHLTDIFEPNCEDEVWLKQLSHEKGWNIFTMDMKIRTSPGLSKIFQESEVISFFLNKSWVTTSGWDRVVKLVKCWPNVQKVVSRAAVPSSFKIAITNLVITEFSQR